MSARVALLVITDGRWDYLQQTLQSAMANLGGVVFDQCILVNDSDGGIAEAPRGWLVVNNPERLGLAGAIGAGWAALDHDITHVFHLEDDFTFPEPVNVSEMVDHLDADPTLAQVALLRQPWSGEEHRAGSIYALNPGDYRECSGLVVHERLFTFNPCVYPSHIATEAGLERDVTDRLLADGYHFAYLGGLDDPPRCTHIGVRRSVGHKW